MTRARVCAAAALVVLLCPTADAQSDRTRWIGVYSNVRYIAQAGDVIGIELVVLPGQDGRTFVLFQEMQGTFSDPQLVEASFNPGTLRFGIRDGDRTIKYEASMGSDQTVVLVNDRNPDKEVLTRGRSYLLNRTNEIRPGK